MITAKNSSSACQKIIQNGHPQSRSSHELGSKTWSEWKQRGELVEEFIGGLNL